MMIVSNTTPISNFLHLNKVQILRHLFKKIHIPPAVKQEIEMAFSDNDKWQKSLSDGFFVVENIKNPLIVRQFLSQLHRGESEALCISIENNATLCLLDDKDARMTATLNNISISGTLGILIQAKKRNFIESVKNVMDELRNNHHFWISEGMYRQVLKLSGEE